MDERAVLRLGEGFGNRPVKIVELSPAHSNIYKALRISSLVREQIALEDQKKGLERDFTRSDEEWKAILSGNMPDGKEGESTHLFAQEGLLIVGMVSASIPEQIGNNERAATIEDLFVEPDQRGRGVGRQLLSAIIDSLRKKRGVVKAQLFVASTQIPARTLYQSLGFREALVRRNQARGEELIDEILMEMPLDGNDH